MKSEQTATITAVGYPILHSTRNSLPEKNRVQVIGIIQERLADSIDLTMQLKHAHWNVKGPQFIALHQLFDQIAEESEKFSDLIAERISQLGGIAAGTLEAVSLRSNLQEYPLTSITEKEHIAALSHSLAVYGELTRETISRISELKDPATTDILTEVLRTVDKYLWFIEAHRQATDERH